VPVKQRAVKDRRPHVPDAAVDLFLKCEKLIRCGAADVFRDPPHPRYREFQDTEHELMQLLGLNYFIDCSPLERRCPPSPGLAMTWPRAREVRLALLATVKRRQTTEHQPP
jgi:hypothetical protein